jgi:flagellar hook-basal body protein
MTFYTSLTGLNASTTQLAVTSNNIANVGTTGFKRSRADFGDIFATSPLQRAASAVGQGVALKAVTQEFSQGNIQFSANSLDIAITGDGFFPLKSADGLQDIYTRNGSFLLNDSFAVVNSAGQSLVAAAVDSSGKADLGSLTKLTVPRSTTGDARETTDIELSLNLPADAKVVTATFDKNDPATYNLTTAVTVFDQGGNEYLANVYYVKTQTASTADPTNKWQTHVYIGETALDEFLVQASAEGGEPLFVNKYGQVKPESQIEPQLIARGVTKLYHLDSLTNRQLSVPAEFEGGVIEAAVLTQLKSGTYDIFANLTGAASANIAFQLNVDDSPTPVTVDLSDLNRDAVDPMSGVELARVLENRINRSYGDQRNFNLDSLLDGTVANQVNLFTVRAGTVERNISTVLPTAANTTIAELETAINASLLAAYPPAVATDPAPLSVKYSPARQTFLFTSNLPASDEISVRSFGNTPSNELFGLTSNYSVINQQTGAYGGLVIPNGTMIRDSDPNPALSDQRYGIRVRFDDTKGVFNILSGTTGDRSSVQILAPDEVAVPGSTAAFANFQKIFNFTAGIQDAVDVPQRGVQSSPAVITGGAIGVNLGNKFRLTSETNKFTITVDNFTGLIELPVGQDFTKESFRALLEQRINSLEDSLGGTVNGVKVDFVNIGSATALRITSATQGDDAFLKVSGPSFWGLNNLGSARGTTERWIAPPQAVDQNGVTLYVGRDGNETTEAGDFSEIETRDLWTPIYLDKGELTFDQGGRLTSPPVPIAYKPRTVGDTGANLQFSINYNGSTQFSSAFSVLAQDQNGRPEGDLIGLNIAEDGLVSANYSNGTQKNLAKIILANFTAPTGLRQLGDSNFLATSASGTAALGEAGTAGFGTVRAGSRERANVDLTQELIELITSQRNFQANAKAIETNNTLTQTIINIRS